MKNKKLPLIVACSVLLSASAFGQDYKALVSQYINNNSNVGKNVANKDFAITNADPSTSLQGTVLNIQQTYNGIPVFGSYATAFVKNNQVQHFIGEFSEDLPAEKILQES